MYLPGRPAADLRTAMQNKLAVCDATRRPRVICEMTLSLAFLSPVLAEAAMEGWLPRGFCIKRLTDLPMLWSEQWRAIGLQAPAQVRVELG